MTKKQFVIQVEGDESKKITSQSLRVNHIQEGDGVVCGAPLSEGKKWQKVDVVGQRCRKCEAMYDA